MSVLRFQLFGKFLVRRDERKLSGLEASKEQELLSYLIVHRNGPHPRESLASLLWANTPTERSKKYLRQTLWHVVSALRDNNASGPSLMQVEHDWVQLDLHDGVWADVAVFAFFGHIRNIHRYVFARLRPSSFARHLGLSAYVCPPKKLTFSQELVLPCKFLACSNPCSTF